jgi:hypothetical protein
MQEASGASLAVRPDEQNAVAEMVTSVNGARNPGRYTFMAASSALWHLPKIYTVPIFSPIFSG